MASLKWKHTRALLINRISCGGRYKTIKKLLIILSLSLCLFLIYLLAYTEISRELPKTEIFVKDNSGIYKNDSDGNHILVYRGKKDYIDTYMTGLSPDNKHMAIVEIKEGITEKSDYKVLPRNNLVICDINGNVNHMIDDDVRKLSWSPDGSKIAYITGTYHEGGRGFRPTGVYIFDIINGSRKPITKDFPHSTRLEGVSGGYAINWAVHDGNIYIMESDSRGGNYMYDVRSGKTRQVDYKGINFSPDGKYYLAIIPEGGNYLYESTTNIDISAMVKPVIGGLPFSWLSDRKHHLKTTKIIYEAEPGGKADSGRQRAMLASERKIKEKRFFIYDVEKSEIVDKWIEKP